MERDEFLRKFLAGLFLIVGLVLFAGVVFVLGIEKGLTEPKFQIEVLYKNVGGLLEGAPIRLAGFNVGYVHKIDFLDQEINERRLKVICSIYNKYRNQLEMSYHYAIKTEGILGEKYVEIKVSEYGPHVDLSKPILGEGPLDVEDSAEIFINTAKLLMKTSQEVNAIAAELKVVLRSTKRVIHRVEQKLMEGTLFKVF